MTAFDSLQDFVDRHRRLFVLTGAGCSTNSGIPDYRDVDGNWMTAEAALDYFMMNWATIGAMAVKTPPINGEVRLRFADLGK